jgi:hypothetical protein
MESRTLRSLPRLPRGGLGHNFDVTSTFGAILPVDQTPFIGRQLVWNSVAQYRVWSKIWPEAEVNHTYFSQGPSDDKTEVFLTPGIVVGRFRIHDRLGFTIVHRRTDRHNAFPHL